MTITKADKKRIMKFIDYYRGLKNKLKSELRSRILFECDFAENTFYYKLDHMNYSRPQVDMIEKIYLKFKEESKDSKVTQSVE